MSDYLGQLIRYGDRLMAEVKQHDYEKPKARRDAAGQRVTDPFCGRCGYGRLASAGDLKVHPLETE